MIEHIVHFKIIRGKEVKQFRGLLYLEENQKPTSEDFLQLLKNIGYDITSLVDPDHFIYQGQEDGKTFKIDILEDHEGSGRDREVENLAKNFMKQDPHI